MTENLIAKQAVDAIYNVHKELGPGLLESAYEACIFYELQNSGLQVSSQKVLPVIYKNNRIECGYRIDLLIENKVIVEIKTVESLNPVHLAQILTYLKLTDCKLGLLVNFNVSKIRDGIKRVVNNL